MFIAIVDRKPTVVHSAEPCLSGSQSDCLATCSSLYTHTSLLSVLECSSVCATDPPHSLIYTHLLIVIGFINTNCYCTSLHIITRDVYAL